MVKKKKKKKKRLVEKIYKKECFQIKFPQK